MDISFNNSVLNNGKFIKYNLMTKNNNSLKFNWKKINKNNNHLNL